AAEAIEYLRTAAPDKETIYYSYVLDSNRKLIGYVSLKDLIIADRNEIVSNIMERELIFARVDEDQEEAARKIQKYELIALPVVNKDDVLVGIITHDDAMDILMQENTEDMEKFMAITGTHEAAMYLKTSVWDHFKNRAVWVIILAALGLISGAIVEGFSELLIQFSILATFMPMLADTGGNTGSQSATLVVRALALNEIKPQDVFRVLLKEVKVASLLALLLAVLAVGRVMLLESGAVVPMGYSIWRIAIAIAIAFGLQVVTATLIGALLPLAAAKLKFDPAVVASPALTTLVDITGLLIYFSTAKLMLGI
ncbi:MAG: magnesium transporter, partial [Spirochaetes bacterium]